jgi:aminoglycoside/choline kinase family phosphotransferase
VILKLPSIVPTNHERAVQFGLYEREFRFYRGLSTSTELRVPACYGSWMDEDSGRSVLVLEDLGQWDPGDDLVGLSPDQARLTVEQVARMHAQWWESPRLGELTWMPTLSSPVTRKQAQLFREGWPAWAQRRGDEVQPAALHIGARLGDDVDALLEVLSRPPITLAHGDLRADNLFFTGDREVAVIDWQLACRARGVLDVAYLLSQSMTVQDRRDHEHDLLQSWHRALVGAGVTGYELADATTDYRQALLISLVCAVAGDSLVREDGRDRALARAQAVRCATAVADNHSR